MYTPVQDGIAKSAEWVRYAEATPPTHLAGLVHCFWELRTLADLPEDFHYHALPDACVNVLLNQLDTNIAGITALHTTCHVLNLGTRFHYVGIQFFPGVWQGTRDELVGTYVGTPYLGTLPLIRTSERLAGVAFAEQGAVLADLVHWCIDHGHVASNEITARILTHLDEIRSVADMSDLVGLSARQLQRILKRTTGFAPHDLLKILRVQQSFRTHYLDLYADQSNFIHAFRHATGYTPVRYRDRFNV